MFIPEKHQVVMPKVSSVALYLDKLTDKLNNRERVKVHIADIVRSKDRGGVGWQVSSASRSVRPGDSSLDFDATGLEAGYDNDRIAERLQAEAVERGYGMVFYAVRNTIYAARKYPE